MLVKFSPIRGDKTITYEQTETDKLKIHEIDTVFDFSDDQIIEYTIPEEAKEYISEAKRDDVGTDLKLTLIRYYGMSEKPIWENPNYNNSDNFRGTDYENYPYNDKIIDENME